MGMMSGVFGLHEQALALRGQRLELLSRNIANADTPHYKAQDIDFKSVLQGLAGQDTAMTVTQPGHLSAGEPLQAPGLRYRVPFNTSFDGNTVEMNVEQAQYGKASTDYQTTLSFLENRISGLRRALRGE